MKSRHPGGRFVRPLQNSTPLSQARYEDLLREMGQLFAQADENADSRKQSVIIEIQALMKQHGLDVQDLE